MLNMLIACVALYLVAEARNFIVFVQSNETQVSIHAVEVGSDRIE